MSAQAAMAAGHQALTMNQARPRTGLCSPGHSLAV